MKMQSARFAADPAPMQAEDHWPEPIDVDFDDDVGDGYDDGYELEHWPLEEDVRRLLDER